MGYLLHKVSRSGWLWGRRRHKVSTYDSTKRVDGRPIPGMELVLNSIILFRTKRNRSRIRIVEKDIVRSYQSFNFCNYIRRIIGESRIGQRVLIYIAKVFKNISVAYSTP